VRKLSRPLHGTGLLRNGSRLRTDEFDHLVHSKMWEFFNLRILQVGLMAVIITGDHLEGQQMEYFNRHDVTTPSHVSMYRPSPSI
jgi:hypothetical protein